MITAIVKGVSRSLPECELTFLERKPIDPDRAALQHRAYTSVLEASGARIIALPAEHDHPDAVFVEDGVIVLDEIAVITTMGTGSRAHETASIAEAVSPHRPLVHIQAPATLEGGDVLRIGRTLFTGLSRRTNMEGITQLRRIVEPLGYTVKPVAVTGCLHLKTGVTSPGRNILLANPDWIDLSVMRGFEVVTVPEEEPWSANILAVGESVLVPASFPRTSALLRQKDFDVLEIDISEFQKAEGGLTCMSVVFEVRGGDR